MKKKFICIYLSMILIVPLFTTTISANQPPTTPHIEGPTTGNVGVPHEYGVCSEDPDEDDITYIINWDDGTEEEHIGPFPTGLCVVSEHTWSTQGEYTIMAKASDGQAESDWGELTVTMPRIRTINSFLSWFLQQFPILRYLLG